MSVLNVADIKAHLNITDDADDALLEQYIEAAEGFVEVSTGYGFDAGTPAPLRQAVRLLVGHWYESREASTVGVTSELIPLGVDALIRPYRMLAVF